MRRHVYVRHSETAAGVVCTALALFLAVQRSRNASSIDFAPTYDAARALLRGESIYSVRDFVYPPFAAVAFIPFALLRFGEAVQIASVLQVVGPLLAAVVVGALMFPKHRLIAAGVAGLVLMKADVLSDSLFLLNPTVLFVFPLVLIAAAWGLGRWVLGAVMLGLSLAVKPLLLVLILIPLVRRDWRTTQIAVAAAALPTLLALALIRDLHGFVSLPGRIAAGTNLHGELQTNNVTLGSVAVMHPSWTVPLLLLRVLLTVATLALVIRTARTEIDPGWGFVLTGALALLPVVVGSLSEIHYCLLGLPACVALITGRFGRVAQLLGATSILVLCVPLSNLHVGPLDPLGAQLRWATGSTLALFACCCASGVQATRRPLHAFARHLALGRTTAFGARFAEPGSSPSDGLPT